MAKRSSARLPARLQIATETVERRIYLIRGHKVLLSSHLAELYDVEVRALIQAVKRNLDRFPADFMFQLTPAEYRDLKSQIVISSWGGQRSMPYAFTQEGVAMLSSVLRSQRAVAMNISIMRAFVRLRDVLSEHKDMAAELERLKREQASHGRKIKKIVIVINQLVAPPDGPPKPYGYRPAAPKAST